jgi:conjugative relaxase-like TrwC/TraI family protein
LGCNGYDDWCQLVLSSAKIGCSSWRYYQDTVAGGVCEYYSEHHDTPGHWHGAGLAALGLQPDALVAEQELEAVFARAINPSTGQSLGASWRSGSVTGYDLTFSAPKSVSALWALGDTATVQAVAGAHTAAVKAALGYLQTHASWSRRGRDGIEQIATTGYAAALFEHGTSRTGDPQLHTHALVLNKVHCTDKTWRTLDGREVYHHKKAAGAIYQAALRTELSSRLGVQFGVVSEHGQAEIAGVPTELLTAWSTRTTAVMAKATPDITQSETDLGRALTGTERARLLKRAVLATRPVKAAHHRDTRQRRTVWATQAAALGWDHHRLLAAITNRSTYPVPGMDKTLDNPAAAVLSATVVDNATHPPGKARVGVGDVRDFLAAADPDRVRAVLIDAVGAVGRSKAIWSRADLTIAVAARLHALPGPRPTDADAAVALVEALTATTGGQHGLVTLGAVPTTGTVRASDPRYASQELLETEARVIDRVLAGIHPGPTVLWDTIQAHTATTPDGTALTTEQARAVLGLVGSQDLLTLMCAPAGAGKTTTLAAAVATWRSLGRAVTCLAPSARAAAELGTATGVPGATVASWLLHHHDTTNTDSGAGAGFRDRRLRPVLLVDEASMLSTTDLDALTTYAEQADVAVVLVGDPAQLGAINAPGGMFEHLTNTLGPRRIELTGLHRFTHPWEAEATLRLREGDPSVLGVYADHDRLHHEGNAAAAADAVFARWHDATQSGQDALMLAQSWSDVSALNTRARAAAITTGQVTGPDLLVVPTRSRSTHGQVEDRTWRAGDLLITRHNSSDIRIDARPLRNGDRFRVLAPATNPPATTAAASYGDAAVGNASGPGDRTGDRTGGGREVVGLQVQCLDTGATTILPTGYLARHVEYGWASTITAAQGATADVGIVLARPGLDQEHFYVAMTRGRQQNHAHSCDELDTGDAGPHRKPGPTGGVTASSAARGLSSVGEQLMLPDPTAAIEQLSRAVTTSGRERAAHSLLAPAIQDAREHTWWATQTPHPPVPDPREHTRRATQLADAHTAHAAAADRVNALREQLAQAQEALTGLRFWSRTRRTDLTTHTATLTTALARAQTDLTETSTRVGNLTAAVNDDISTRERDARAGLLTRHQQWATHAPEPHHDPVLIPEPTQDPWADLDPWTAPTPHLDRAPVRGL